MTRYLIDSDGVIDYLKGFQPTVEFIQRLSRRGDIPCTCDMVMGEVYGGVYPQDEAVADALFSVFEYLPTSPGAAKQAGRWKYAYARQGQTLKITDCVIAAVAYEHDAQLVTRNVRDFPMPEITLAPLPQPPR